jgi:hypothetical protein
MPDYKELCGDLLNRLNGLYEELIDAGAGWIPPEAQELMNHAWEAMAEPEPEGAIPVNERLPYAAECDECGRCWLLTVEDEYPQWRLHSIEGHRPGGKMIWVPVDSDVGVMVDCFYASHWLPFDAIPLPNCIHGATPLTNATSENF